MSRWLSVVAVTLGSPLDDVRAGQGEFDRDLEALCHYFRAQ